jgi:hypothetical protein
MRTFSFLRRWIGNIFSRRDRDLSFRAEVLQALAAPCHEFNWLLSATVMFLGKPTENSGTKMLFKP